MAPDQDHVDAEHEAEVAPDFPLRSTVRVSDLKFETKQKMNVCHGGMSHSTRNNFLVILPSKTAPLCCFSRFLIVFPLPHVSFVLIAAISPFAYLTLPRATATYIGISMFSSRNLANFSSKFRRYTSDFAVSYTCFYFIISFVFTFLYDLGGDVLCPYTRPSPCYCSMFCLAFLPEEKCSSHEIKLSGRLGQSCLLRPLVFSWSSRSKVLVYFISSVPPSVTPKAGYLTWH